MKNKGFTLIEMLVVIAILGAIGLVVTISFMQSLKDTQQDQCDAFVEEIEDAASVYASLTSTDCDVMDNEAKCCDRDKITCKIYLTYLLEAGLLSTETDECDNNKSITTKDEDKYVLVTWDADGNKVVTYKGDTTYGG